MKRVRMESRHSGTFRGIRNNWELYLFVFPTMLYYLIFVYMPIYGVQIAFKNFNAVKGIWGSTWVGLANIERFLNSYYFPILIKNTLGISLYELAIGFPIPILIALALNELDKSRFKSFVQTVIYAPHFISTVVMSGMIISFLSPTTGLVNFVLRWMGFEPIPFMMEVGWFKTIYVLSNIWQNAGWGTIIYLATLAGVDPQQHESAIIDGASRLQRIRYINIPAILPTMMIILILNSGNMMSVGFEKVYLLQNQLNIESSEVISTYVYKSGLQQAQYSFASAVGLFNSVINLLLLLLVNRLARRYSETSLW